MLKSQHRASCGAEDVASSQLVCAAGIDFEAFEGDLEGARSAALAHLAQQADSQTGQDSVRVATSVGAVLNEVGHRSIHLALLLQADVAKPSSAKQIAREALAIHELLFLNNDQHFLLS